MAAVVTGAMADRALTEVERIRRWARDGETPEEKARIQATVEKIQAEMDAALEKALNRLDATLRRGGNS